MFIAFIYYCFEHVCILLLIKWVVVLPWISWKEGY